MAAIVVFLGLLLTQLYTSIVAVDVCAGLCAVRFCDASSILQQRNSDVPLGALCLDGKPLTNVPYGRAQVLVNGFPTPLEKYRPVGLQQAFSPTLFKVFTASNGTSMLGHETIQANQANYLNNRCLSLSLGDQCIHFTFKVPGKPANPATGQKSTPSVPTGVGRSRSSFPNEKTGETPDPTSTSHRKKPALPSRAPKPSSKPKETSTPRKSPTTVIIKSNNEDFVVKSDKTGKTGDCFLNLSWKSFIHRDAGVEVSGRKGTWIRLYPKACILANTNGRGFSEPGTSKLATSASFPCSRVGALKSTDFTTYVDFTKYHSIDNVIGLRCPLKFDDRKGQFLEREVTVSNAGNTSTVTISAEAQLGLPGADELPGDAGDYLAPNIKYNLVIELERIDDTVSVSISGNHQRFPFYEFIANSHSLYTFTPKNRLPVPDLIQAAVQLLQTTPLFVFPKSVPCTSGCPTPKPTSTSSCAVDGVAGTCLSKKETACSGGKFVSGHCPGPANVQCCVPETDPLPAVTDEPAAHPMAYLYTDPHLKTFDGLRYSCQGIGEFVLVKSESGFEAQARFHGNATRLSASVTVGVAVKAPGSPKIQVSIPGGSACSEPDVYVDGKRKSPGVFRGVQVRSISIAFSSGTLLTWSMSYSSTFGCYFERLAVRLAAPERGNGRVRGLLGTPDGSKANEWSTKGGRVLKVPASLYGKEAYEYCTKQWCLRNATESLFAYTSGTSFATMNACDAPYRSLELSSASTQLRTLCQGDISCIFDGLATGSLDEARRALRAREILEYESAALARGENGSELLGKTFDADYTLNRNLLVFKTQKRISVGQFDYEVTAAYNGGKGKILARLDVEKRQLVGNWSNPAGSCRSRPDRYSGMLVFNFSADWNSFTGLWSQCFDEPHISWTGKESSPAVSPTPSAAPSRSPFATPTSSVSPTPSSQKPLPVARGGRELMGKRWSTTYGEMTFESQKRISVGRFEYSVTGNYSLGGGKILAVLDVEKRELVGNWSEVAIGCSAPGPYGHNYWGALSFTFSADWDSFQGKWGSCSSVPPSLGWTGQVIRT